MLIRYLYRLWPINPLDFINQNNLALFHTNRGTNKESPKVSEDFVNSFVCFLLQDAYRNRIIFACLVGTKVMFG